MFKTLGLLALIKQKQGYEIVMKKNQLGILKLKNMK